MSREKIKRVTRHVSADDGAATRVVCCSRRVDWTDRDSSSEDHRIVFLLDDRGIGIDTYGRETSSERSEEKRTRMITRRWAMMMKETHALVQVETILLHFSGGEDRTNKSQLLRTSTGYTEWWRRSSLFDSMQIESKDRSEDKSYLDRNSMDNVVVFFVLVSLYAILVRRGIEIFQLIGFIRMKASDCLYIDVSVYICPCRQIITFHG